MKKYLTIIISLMLMFSMMLKTFAISITEKLDTSISQINTHDEPISYKGDFSDLPEYIQESYKTNEIAETIDIYDEDPYSFTVINSDGTKTIEIFQKPIKYVEDNEIKFIDSKIEERSLFDKVLTNHLYGCENAPIKSLFPSKIKDGIIVFDDKYEIKCSPNTEYKLNNLKKLFSKPILEEQIKLTYENVFDYNDSVTYQPIINGIKEEIVIEEYNGNNIYEFTIELKNLLPLYFNGDAIPLIDKETGEEIASISQIDMRDSSQGESFNTSLFNKIELSYINEDIYNLKIILDEEFLTSESTVYPVIVDPTITFNADPIYDAPVFSGYPNNNFNSNTYNVVGYHGSDYGEGISFIKINNIQNYVYINPNNIYSAYLKVYEGSGKTSSATVGVYNTYGTWNNTNITYNNMPSLYSGLYSSNTITSSGWYNFDIKGFVQNWLKYELQEGGQSQNYGLALKMISTGVSSRHFCSANHSTYPPSIVINYNEDMSLAEGEYFIKSEYSGLYLDTELNVSANGNVIQYPATGHTNQIWTVEKTTDGYYILHSKYYSNISNLGVSSSTPTNGTNVSVYSDSVSNFVKFRIIKNANFTYRILSICNSQTQGLDVCGPSTAATTNIQTWQYLGVPQQQWHFYKVSPSVQKLNAWFDDTGDGIGYFADKSLRICVEKSSGFDMSVLLMKYYASNAVSKWSDLGVTSSFVSDSQNCDIYIKGITRAEANAMSFSPFAVGVTMNLIDSNQTAGNTSYLFEGYAVDVNNAALKAVYSISKRTIYLIWDENTYCNTSDFNMNEWKAVFCHEMGHALGYIGHTVNDVSLMSNTVDQYSTSSNANPSSGNINHLKQVY